MRFVGVREKALHDERDISCAQVSSDHKSFSVVYGVPGVRKNSRKLLQTAGVSYSASATYVCVYY